EHLGGAVDGVERLRKAGGEPPADGGLRVHRRRDAGGEDTGDAGGLDEGTAVHVDLLFVRDCVGRARSCERALRARLQATYGKARTSAWRQGKRGPNNRTQRAQKLRRGRKRIQEKELRIFVFLLRPLRNLCVLCVRLLSEKRD